MSMRWWRVVGLLVTTLTVGLVPSVLASPPAPPDIALEAAALLGASGSPALVVRDVSVEGDALTVCLTVPIEALSADGWLAAEQLLDTVRLQVSSLQWRSLSVQAWDEVSGTCRPLSDFAPRQPVARGVGIVDGAADIPVPVPTSALPDVIPEGGLAFPRSLAGRTVYLSPGHGWSWNGTTWRTQRPVYQGFIEDHNNAEVVAQYLIPYLQNAGATVISARETDWSEARAIADNDAGAPTYTETGTWRPGASGPGYAGGSYRYAITEPSGVMTARATWMLSVPAQGRYAVYAWVYPGSNRVRDAHYTVHHAAGASEVIIDQSTYPRTWRYLGTFPFYAGSAMVTLDNRTADTTLRAVIADAIRLGSGQFDSLAGIPDHGSAPLAPNKPWWESASYYWSQWMGLDPADWPYLNDVVVRPMYARWYERASDDNGVFISWHTNGSTGTARGTVSYVHNNETYPRTAGSTELQAAVHNELVADIRAGWDAGWADLGKRQLNLGEMRMLYDPYYAYASIPGVLLEIAFHDNYDDALALKDPGFAQLTARAVYQGIVKYFEGRDGVDLVYAPEPPTRLRVANAGSGSLQVSWSPAPVDGVGGEGATGYRVYTSPDGFAWGAPVAATSTSTVVSGLAQGQTLYVRVTATNDGGESFPTEVLGARVGEARLLIVNGFDKLNLWGLVNEVDPVEGANLRMWVDRINSRSYVVHHGQAVPVTHAWDSASNEAVASGAVSLAAYRVVDWILGEESSVVDRSFNSTERSLVSSYLASGGSLLVSGSEFAWDLEALGADPDFLHTQLRTDYIADDAGTYTARPVSGRAFSGLSDLHFDAPDEYGVDYPDVLAPLSGAQTALTYVNAATPGTAAVQFAQGCQKLLVFGFPLETLRVAERAPVMAAALAYLDVCAVETTIAHPAEGTYVSATPTLQGTASGVALTKVELNLRRLADANYWTGDAWTTSPAWFPAVGTLAWQYSFTAWFDGAYTLQARAVGAETDPSPAEVTFTLDRSAPLAATAVTPTGGVFLQGPLISLVWLEPADAGSPLHYGVEVDGRRYVFADPPGIVGLGLGDHEWRVRTEDAAMNVSAWSAWHGFEVDVEQAFLPLILRAR